MRHWLKPVSKQNVVIVGASSGIGLRAAQMAAAKGARVTLVARNEEALAEAVEKIRGAGGQATFAVADVADESRLREATETAASAFGPIDSWAHVSGVGMWGAADEVPEEDARRLFETNFWGVVHGARVAKGALRERGGALVVVGSVESERALPLHSFYSASKHAVKGYVEAIRMEMEKEGLPISVSLVKPASIDTPFVEHARNYMKDASPRLMPPVYDTDLAARAVIACCESARRDVTVGGSGFAIQALERAIPRALDQALEWFGFDAQKRSDFPRRYRDGLDRAAPNEGYVRGLHDGRVMAWCPMTEAALRPALQAAAFVGLAGLLWGALRSSESSRGAGDRRSSGARRGSDGLRSAGTTGSARRSRREIESRAARFGDESGQGRE